VGGTGPGAQAGRGTDRLGWATAGLWTTARTRAAGGCEREVRGVGMERHAIPAGFVPEGAVREGGESRCCPVPGPQATLDACTDYIAVEQVPGLQLKGKSAETFRVFQVVSIRQDTNSQWVPFPTEAANEAYTAIRRQHASR